MTESGPEPNLNASVSAAAEPSGTGKPLRRALSAAAAVVVLAFLVVAVVSNWEAIRADVAALTAVDWAVSFGFGLAGISLTWGCWYVLLLGLGGHLSGADSRALFFSSQLGKYVPGSVWPAVIQSEMGRRRGVPRTTMVASYFYALAIGLASGALVGLATVTQTRANDARWISIAAALAAVVGLVFVAHPNGALQQMTRLAKRFGRTIEIEQPRTRSVMVALGVTMASWVMLTVHVFAIARPLGADTSDLLIVMGGFALAYVAGILALPVPGGAGVREGVLVITIGSAIGRPGALTVALISRFVLLAVDITLAGGTGAIPLLRSARSGKATDELGDGSIQEEPQ